ncbi:MAG: class I SAM-dependent methyltransferase, partial [Candidatus Peregrinibacteria bacterium]|nr:class I SAM-dependent methyltransferase [Candidatus Peregrinibacteria bacterium]
MSVYLFIIAMLLLPIGLAGLSLAPWVPTSRADFARINTHLKLKNGSVFYELGSGDGRVCRYIAKHNPQANVVGIELALPMYLIAVIQQKISPLKNLSYVHGNALTYNLSDADAIYTYALINTINEKLTPKFLKELTPG